MRDSFRELLRRTASCDSIDFGARMLFVLFLLSSWVTTEPWYFKLPLRVLALSALVLPPLHRDIKLWTAFAILLCAKTACNWFTQDNHLFLLTWFAVGTALALGSASPERAASDNARRLIGLSFLFAVLWKGPLSGEFLNGGYFSHAFLSDSRFHGAARLFCGVPEEALRANYAAAGLGNQASLSMSLAGFSPRVLAVARISAWWTLAIESALAITFLVPETWARLHRARHWVLFLFGVSTYAIVDIETFGWTLMAIGAAQVEPGRHFLRVLYLATGLLIIGYDYVPVLDWLARLIL